MTSGWRVTDERERTRRRVSLGLTLIVFAWSIVELINLSGRHTLGPEVYGVIVATVAVGTAALSLVILGSAKQRVLASVGVLILWAVVALGGVAGTAAHVVGPSAEHGPADPRPRPAAAPLIFTLLGAAGAASLVYGTRLRMPRVR